MHGAQDFYSGELARLMTDHVQARGGMLTRKDMTAYRAKIRAPLVTPLGRWQVATNPSPAIGGVVLTAMLMLVAGEYPSLPKDPTARQIAAQRLVLGYRDRRVNRSPAIERDLAPAHAKRCAA